MGMPLVFARLPHQVATTSKGVTPSPVAPKAFTATKSNFFSSIMALTSVLPLPSTVQLAEVLEPASFWALFCHTASVRMPTCIPGALSRMVSATVSSAIRERERM